MDALAAGRHALAEYDFEQAHVLFERAFRGSAGGVAAAAALLDLLVNHLSDDPAALMLESSLSPSAAADPEVRAALALAAARQGEEDRALRWANGLSSAGALDALELLAESALRRGDVERTRGLEQELRRRDPLRPSLARLTAGLERLRGAERRPLEDELRAWVAAGDWPRAETAARALLARWPESEAGRDALRAVDRSRHLELARGLADRATQARERSDGVGLVRLAEQARALVVGEAEQEAWWSEAARAGRELVELGEVAVARTALEAGDLVAGLRIADRLGEAGRRALLQVASTDELSWMLEMPRGEDRVSGALAVGHARRALSSGDADRALALLEPHLRVVRASPVGRETLARAEGLRREQAENLAFAALARAREALANERLEEAAEQAGLAGGVPGALEVRLAIAALRTRRANEAGLALEETRGNYTRARELADHLGAAAATDLETRLTRLWQPVRREDVAGTLRAFLLDNTSPMPRTWLSVDGQTVVLVRGFGRELVAWVCDAAGLAVRHAWTWTLPVPVQVSTWVVDGDVLRVTAREVALVEVSLADGRVRRWCPPVPDIVSAQGCTVVQEGRYVWALCLLASRPETRAYAVDRWPAFRVADRTGAIHPLWGTTPPLVAVCGITPGLTLHHPGGRRLSSTRTYVPDKIVTRAVVNVHGEPLVAMLDASASAAELRKRQPDDIRPHVPDDPLAVSYSRPRVKEGKMATYQVSSASRPHMLAPARREQRSYALMSSVSTSVGTSSSTTP